MLQQQQQYSSLRSSLWHSSKPYFRAVCTFTNPTFHFHKYHRLSYNQTSHTSPYGITTRSPPVAPDLTPCTEYIYIYVYSKPSTTAVVTASSTGPQVETENRPAPEAEVLVSFVDLKHARSRKSYHIGFSIARPLSLLSFSIFQFFKYLRLLLACVLYLAHSYILYCCLYLVYMYEVYVYVIYEVLQYDHLGADQVLLALRVSLTCGGPLQITCMPYPRGG